jgi:hypothetical protein
MASRRVQLTAAGATNRIAVIVNGWPRRSRRPRPVIGDAHGFPRVLRRPSPGRSAATLSREGRGRFAMT